MPNSRPVGLTIRLACVAIVVGVSTVEAAEDPVGVAFVTTPAVAFGGEDPFVLCRYDRLPPAESADEATAAGPIRLTQAETDAEDVDVDTATAYRNLQCDLSEDELASLYKPATELSASLSLAPADERPCDAAADYYDNAPTIYVGRTSWANVTPNAMNFRFYHRPLWYEDANLERCGRTFGKAQPLASAAYFYLNSFLLPYRLVAEPQKDCVYAKPFCGPCQKYSFRDNYLPPASAEGTAAQVITAVGLVFLIP